MLEKTYPMYVGGEAVAPNHDLEIVDKFTGEVATRVPLADPATIERAIGLAADAVAPMAALHAYERQNVLMHCVRRFEERAEELAMAL
jgi:acyl-CoA reductase-like NAD-dependent aldehyde dehydrogenase